MATNRRVAIIGAGMAGLSCATALNNAGIQVQLFEKSRGVSGRLSTRQYEDWQCDHGAQYFTARDPRFDAEVQRWISQGVAQQWQPSLKVFDGNTLINKQNNANTTRYVGYPSNNTPVKFLASTLAIVTEATVIGLHKRAGQWLINTMEHGVYADTFDDVILAIPAPQAAELLNNTPSLLISICNAVTMRPCFALMLRYAHTIACQFDGLFIQSGLLTWAARDSAKPGRKQPVNQAPEVWVLHASAEWSALHLHDEPETVAQAMHAEFNRLVKLEAALTSSAHAYTPPMSHSLHRWLYADCEHYLSDISQYDADQGIGLCGDWLNGGKVQGAWLSGLDLADKLMANKLIANELMADSRMPEP